MLIATLLACLSLTRAHAVLAVSPQRPLIPLHAANSDLVPNDSRMTFRLRHLHALHPDTHTTVLKNVIHHESSFSSEPSMSLRTKRTTVHRPRSQSAFHEARAWSRQRGQSTLLDWDEEEIEAPDVTDNETLLLLAKMTNDAYVSPGDSEWYELGDKWNVVRMHIPVLFPCVFL